MDDTNESEKKRADLFAEKTQSSDLIESPDLNALTMPERPQSIKRRHSLAIPGLNEDKQQPSSVKGDDKDKLKPRSGLSFKKSIALVVGLLALTFFAMVANILAPLIAFQFFPPKWIVDFRHGVAISRNDWTQGNELMLAALAQGKKENAPIQQQMKQTVGYGQTLQGHGDFELASKTFRTVGETAARNGMPDKEALAMVYAAECDHQLFLQDFAKKPDPALANKALLFDEHLPPQNRDKDREAFAVLAVAKIEGDLGKEADAERHFSEAEKLWADNPAQLGLVSQSRWRDQVVANLRHLSSRTLTSKAVNAKSHVDADSKTMTSKSVIDYELPHMADEQQMVMNLLSRKDFGRLNKLFDDARLHRKRWRSGYEQTDYLYTAVTYVYGSSDFIWQEKLNLLKEWCAINPESPTPHIALACFYDSYAQQARNAKNPSAKTITLFRDRMYLGVKELAVALEKGPPTQDWFGESLRNFYGNSDNNITDHHLYEELIDAASASYPDYLPIYFDKARYLQEERFGTHAEWLKYITDESNKLKPDDGDKLYARFVQEARIQNNDVSKKIPNIDYARVAKGQAAIKKEFPGESQLDQAEREVGNNKSY